MSDITLEDVLILEGLDYKVVSGRSGNQLNIRECPACGKTEWKVYANEETSLGNCFSGNCGLRFNLFGFVRELLTSRGGSPRNSDVAEYLRQARQKLGYRPKRPKPRITAAVSEEGVILPFSSPIPDLKGVNHPYLESRGITGEYAGEFHLRFSLFGWHEYKDENGETRRQDFSNRIIIPVYDLNGELRTFQGRDVTGASKARYKFAGGLPGTGRYIYNGHAAKALSAQHITLSEGPFDVWKTKIATDQAPDLAKIVPCGTFGMELSQAKEGDDQMGALARLKKAGLKRVTMLWDPEPKAYLKAIEACLRISSYVGIETYLALLPQGKDPGDADAIMIQRAVRDAVPVTRMSALKLRMNNPYEAKTAPA